MVLGMSKYRASTVLTVITENFGIKLGLNLTLRYSAIKELLFNIL